ncbi:hypothetical protein [Candidatus Chloroploca sp. Khr17]|uniref:hypothetical protein n=1 Tax=Candidatus Chloroploca sp. Khr17 TaxID=2496869 RepID=UPI00101DBA33|nr:hypothetical protein [Candidatus Chloroploca sp. Khr17]
MSLLLLMLLIFVVVLALLLGLGIGVALLLHWLLPAVGLEIALLVAVLAVGQAMLIFGRVLSALPPALAEVESEREPPLVILDREVTLPRRRGKRT